MSVDHVEEARDAVLLIGGHRAAGETWDVVLWRAVARTGLPHRRLWSYLYRRIQRPTADDMDVLRAAREREKALIKQRWSNIELDNQWAEKVARFERLAKDVDESAVRRADAATMPMEATSHHDSRRTDQALGRLLDGKAHRVGAR